MKRTILVTIAVKVPDGVSDTKALGMVNRLIANGREEAFHSMRHDECDPAAELAVSMTFGRARIVK